MEWFDTLITVICGPTESASPLVKTHEVQQPAPPSSTSLDASTCHQGNTQKRTSSFHCGCSLHPQKIWSTSCAALLFTTRIR